ncbi:MAG: TDG/mug DNA glycosylase family protein [Gammaproteobacteria bacterium]|jgi:TDG/mug DNA glycosylase family protein
MRTLPDFLEPGLAVISIGLNPSLPSVEAGFYFANPRNRFWRAWAAAGVDGGFAPAVPVSPTDGQMAQKRLLREHRIGFTDVVKRPTAGAAGLRAADFQIGVSVLERKLLDHAPGVAWFHGKVAYEAFARRRADPTPLPANWGAQDEDIGGARIYVSPNPSSANAAFSLEDLAKDYRRMFDIVRSGRW